ncbi:MAG: pyridoxal kinase, partial [Hyphomicrobiales bacterium]|nr:pyridoxal kinase [Hyphomicrobiales bacterium]
MTKLPSVNRAKAVLVVSSHVVRGTIGNRAIAFALEALGHPVWALPTVTLPWHPGHGTGTRIIPDEKDFIRLCDDLANAPWIDEIAAVITGFMAND